MSAPRYRRARELAGLTMGQAARLLGVSVVRISDYERGLTDPDDATARQCAARYGVSLAWLRGADPVLSVSSARLLRDSELSFDDREALTELLGAIYTPADGS